jgi:hypothetical protein
MNNHLDSTSTRQKSRSGLRASQLGIRHSIGERRNTLRELSDLGI